jgi:hypothetical protein
MPYRLRTVISGSYGKHFEQMLQIKKFLENQQVIVQAPVSEQIVPGTDEFILLDADPVGDPRILQDSIFAKIRMSSFLTVANIDGYLGRAAVLEVGYAVAMGINVLTVEPIDDPNLGVYTRTIASVFPAWAGVPAMHPVA